MAIRIGRREALQSVAAGVGLCFPVRGQALSGITGRTTEWAFTTGKQYADPFSKIELDVVIRARNGNQELRVPAFRGERRPVQRATREREKAADSVSTAAFSYLG